MLKYPELDQTPLRVSSLFLTQNQLTSVKSIDQLSGTTACDWPVSVDLKMSLLVLSFKVVRTGQGLKNNVPSFSIQLIFGHICEQSQNLEPICALVLE